VFLARQISYISHIKMWEFLSDDYMQTLVDAKWLLHTEYIIIESTMARIVLYHSSYVELWICLLPWLFIFRDNDSIRRKRISSLLPPNKYQVKSFYGYAPERRVMKMLIKYVSSKIINSPSFFFISSFCATRVSSYHSWVLGLIHSTTKKQKRQKSLSLIPAFSIPVRQFHNY
jgi:hypothetical protein